MGTDLARMRLDYETSGISVEELAPDPIEQFERWLDDAVTAGLHEPNAMVVSTVDADGQPWSRFLLLKGVGAGGFDFFTNYESLKSQQMDANPRASLTFGWLDLHRQVNISGSVTRLDDESSDRYWAVRTRGAQIGGWASAQSTELSDRRELLDRYDEMERRFDRPAAGDDGEVPRPPHWGGWRLRPHTVEFWQGRRNRLHDRVRYRLDGGGVDLDPAEGDQAARTWSRVRLSP